MYSRHSFALPVLLIVFGIGLIVSCLGMARSGEGVYDRESAQWMRGANITGILLGLLLVICGVRMYIAAFGALGL